jgi:glycosyltransferase involved in cell wall biosynthesis
MPVAVIIPAHQESSVITRCLRNLTEGARDGELEVIVVCNACTDGTAELARGFAPTVKVIETDVPSKSNALNLGDDAARWFPRFYVDADVQLSLESIRAVAPLLEQGEYLAAAPRIDVDLTGCAWGVRAFYRVWLGLPYFRENMIGSGVYALSRQGRGRFGKFPDTKADDTYVRLLFTNAERKAVNGCSFTIMAPKTLRELIRIKARSHFGTQELKAQYPNLFSREVRSHKSALIENVVTKPGSWPDLVVYVCVKAVSRVRSFWKMHFGDRHKWERDETSRSGQVPPLGGGGLGRMGT